MGHYLVSKSRWKGHKNRHLLLARQDPVVKLHASQYTGQGPVSYFVSPCHANMPRTINAVLATNVHTCSVGFL